MKQQIKYFLSFLLFITGITPLYLRLRLLNKRQIFVLLYHRIRKAEDPFEAAVSPENFERQLRFLKNNFEVVPLREALERKARNRTSKRPLAVITFDDGYLDNIKVAHPILKRHALPATFFLAAGSIGNEEPMWTSRVETIFKNTPVRNLALATLSKLRHYELDSPDERMRVCYEVKREMKEVPDERRQAILEELEAKAGPVERGELQSEMMSWEEARRLASDPGVEIGSHSVSHRMLANLSDEAIRGELEESKRVIEREIGRPVRFLSYPGNSYDERVKKQACVTGYQAALAVDQAITGFEEDPFSLKRLHIEDGPLHLFQAELALLFPLPKFFTNRRNSRGGSKR